MENTHDNRERALRIVECILPDGEKLFLLGNESTTLFFRIRQNSPWEPVTPRHIETITEIMNQAELIRTYGVS